MDEAEARAKAEAGRQNFVQFMDRFDKLRASMERNTEAMVGLFSVINDDKDGLVSAIDDLIGELQAHRAEMTLLRAAIGGAKVNLDIGGILGIGDGPKRRK